MYYSSPTSNITPAMTSVAMSRSDSRDSTCSNLFTSYPTSAYAALMSASPPKSSWPTSHPLARSDSSTSESHARPTSTSMRRDSSNSSWIPSPYRSCMSSFGTEPSSYLSEDDLLFPPDSLPVETISNPEPKKEMTTEEQIAFLRELAEKEAAHQQEQKRKAVRFASHDADRKPRRPSTLKRRQTTVRKSGGASHGPQ